MKSIIPIGNRVLVKLSEPKSKTSGGILIPDGSVDRPVDGEVEAVGWSSQDSGHAVRPGIRVLLPKFGGLDVNLEDGDYVIIAEEDILGVIVEGDDPPAWAYAGNYFASLSKTTDEIIADRDRNRIIDTCKRNP